MQLFNTMVAHAIPWLPRASIHAISRKYIAGDTFDAALARIHQLQAQGYCVTIDVLGETISTLEQAVDTTREYLAALTCLGTQGLDAGISVKPSALGLLLDLAHCEKLLDRILVLAGQHQIPVCMDMEDVRCTQAEIDMFLRLRVRHHHLSIALQAYLTRTYADLERLVQERHPVRLCKGIYREAPSHLVAQAGQDRRAINPHFLKHVTHCLKTHTFVAIATHDEALVEQIIALVADLRADHAMLEFQMLLGVCEALRDRLLARGFRVRIYLPYGKDWYGYSTRRLKENPSIAGYILKSLFGR